MRSNYTDYKPRTINRNGLTNQRHHVGQDDKGWSALVTLLDNRKEMWWVMVMGVELDPELSKMVCALRSGYCPNRGGI